MVKKSNPGMVRKRVASDILGKMRDGEDLDIEAQLDGLTNDDLVSVAHNLKALVSEGSAGAGVPLVKVMEYIDRRADFKRQGIAAEETARLCVNAIKELKEKGYQVYDAPKVVDATV